jgi:predicted dehydrogenase
MMGRHHARVLNSLEGVELVAVADPFGDVHGAAGARPVEGDVRTLLEHDLDYCVVAVPAVLHEDVGLALADAGVHALIEKPLALDARVALTLAQAFRSQGLIGAVGYIERYNPALRQARARIEAGELGELYQIVTRRQGPFPTRVAEVGVVKDLGTHDLDLTAWVTREHFASVAARTTHRSGRTHEDLAVVLGQLSAGTLTNHLVNWLSPFKERVTVITGTQGAFVADTLTADLSFYANGEVEQPWDAIANFRGVSEGDVIRYAIPKPEPLRVEHEQFRDALLGRHAEIVTMDQGLSAVRVSEAVLESARTGQTVYITERSGA